MHSTWNSCPHGRLITLLSPSTYSSRHTTHSTCLPEYLRGQRLDPEPDFSPDGPCASFASAALETIPDVVWERGLDRADGEREPETRRGELGVDDPGLDDWDADEDAGMV